MRKREYMGYVLRLLVHENSSHKGQSVKKVTLWPKKVKSIERI